MATRANLDDARAPTRDAAVDLECDDEFEEFAQKGVGRIAR